MPITKEVAKDLMNLRGAWKEAKPQQTRSGLPDGEYLTQILSMGIGRSKAGRLQATTTFLVKDGKNKGKKHMKFDSLETDSNIGWFKSYCEILGIELPENPGDLPAVLDEFVASNTSLVNITIKTNKEGFTNTYVKSLSDYEVDGDSGGEVEAIAEDFDGGEELIEEEFVDGTGEEEAEYAHAAPSRPAVRPRAVASSKKPVARRK